MPTIDIIIMSGIMRKIGFGGPSERVNMKVTMPSMATTMTTGMSFIRMFPGVLRGISGAGSRCTSPPGGLGADIRGALLNWSVLTESPLFSTTERPTLCTAAHTVANATTFVEPATVADHDRTTPEVRTPEHRMAETVDTERTPNRERRTARDSHPRVRRRGDHEDANPAQCGALDCASARCPRFPPCGAPGTPSGRPIENAALRGIRILVFGVAAIQ